MKTRALVIDQIAKKDIERVIKYAFVHKIPIETMRKMVSGEVVAPGYSPNYSCEIFQGYRVVLSIEEHPMGWCRHISISVDGGMLPSIEATKLIIKEFGFESPLENCMTRIEEMPDDIERPKAIDVIEPINQQ